MLTLHRILLERVLKGTSVQALANERGCPISTIREMVRAPLYGRPEFWWGVPRLQMESDRIIRELGDGSHTETNEASTATSIWEQGRNNEQEAKGLVAVQRHVPKYTRGQSCLR